MKDTIDKTIAYYDPDTCDLGEFTALIDQETRPEQVPHAALIEKNIPIYDMADLRTTLEDDQTRRTLMSEWAQVLRSGAGVVALKGGYADTAVLDEATRLYEGIIVEEKQGTGGAGDHFAASGANDRIWNALQKLCEASPRYF